MTDEPKGVEEAIKEAFRAGIDWCYGDLIPSPEQAANIYARNAMDALFDKERLAAITPAGGVVSPKGQEAEGWRDCHGLDTPERVCFYEQDFYVLSNFSSFEVEWASSGRFKTAEHLYHWLRFATGEANGKLGGAQPSAMAVAIADRVRRAPSAHEAFKIAQDNKHLQRADWNEVKVEKMRMVIRAKAMQHEYVLRKLLATSDRELVENSWRDDFWGWGENRDGQNVLGKLWMEVRSELRAAAPLATSPTRDEAP